MLDVNKTPNQFELSYLTLDFTGHGFVGDIVLKRAQLPEGELLSITGNHPSCGCAIPTIEDPKGDVRISINKGIALNTVGANTNIVFNFENGASQTFYIHFARKG